VRIGTEFMVDYILLTPSIVAHTRVQIQASKARDAARATRVVRTLLAIRNGMESEHVENQLAARRRIAGFEQLVKDTETSPQRYTCDRLVEVVPSL
jgi:hypothetical protein